MDIKTLADEILEMIGDKEPASIEVPLPEEIIIPEVVLTTQPWEELGDGIRMQMRPFSEAFWPPSQVPDHYVPFFEGYETAEPLAIYIPPKEDFEWVSFSFTNKIKPLYVGPTGCGKTQLFEYYAAITGRPCLRVDNTQELDKAQVFGTVHITDGDTDFVPGDIPQSATAPTVVILDEVSRAPGGANMIYKRMLDRNEIYMPEMKEAGTKVIIPHPHWVVCGTDNTKGDGEDMGKYPMSNVQDAAFRNAWGILLEADYLDKGQELEMIKQWAPAMPKDEARKLATLSNLLHTGFKRGDINTAFSPRQLQTICKFFNQGISILTAVKMAYTNFTSKSEVSDIQESINAAFGSK